MTMTATTRRVLSQAAALLVLLMGLRDGSTGHPRDPVRAFISGIVLDGQTHEPIENATVRIPELSLVRFTDEHGHFIFPPVEPGTLTLEITRIGYKRTVMNTRIKEDRETPTLYIHLFPIPIQTAAVVITGEHADHRFDDPTSTATVLRGKELQRELGQTLAATLKNETGLAIRSMGPAPARPVIRGLGGDRIVISEDGVRTSDLSATSPDHAVTVEPFTVERIEVLRGPRVLLRSSTTLGGIVNIVRNEIPSVLPPAITGTAGLFGESSSNGVIGSASVVVPLAPFVLRGEISTKNAGDLRTPAGTLGNSYGHVTGWSGGGSVVGSWGHAGASVREYSTDYGVPGGFVGAHPRGVDISIFRRQLSARGTVNTGGGLVESIDLEFGRTYYRHVEHEKSGLIGAEFLTHTCSGSAVLHHPATGVFQEGAAGMAFDQREFSVGGFVFTPASTSLNGSAFAFESLLLGDLEVQGAVRLDHHRITPQRENLAARIGPIRERTFTTWSASASAMFDLGSGLFGGIAASRSSRVPTIEELYSEGPHLAAYSYEVGSPLLSAEYGLGMEAFLLLKRPSLFAMVTVFRNDLPYYIITQNTGRINFTTLLPAYASTGVSALLTGVETQVEWRVSGDITALASLGLTHGTNRTAGRPLPAIPPMKGTIEMRYTGPALSAGAAVELASAQTRVDEFEDPTEGYGLLNIFVQTMFATGPVVHNVTLAMDNVFDKEYRNHLSRVKVVMPEAGRNIRAIYRLYF
jgi:iron complex outermembrane receptor protein